MHPFYGFVLRSELIFQLLRFLDGNPLVGKDLGVKHLLVDEYQDLNYCDQQVIERLEEYGADLFIVGDDDQSIYEFRHAYPDGIRHFTHLRPGSGDYHLTICRRCPETVVNLAKNLIAWDPGRINKFFQPEQPSVAGEVHVLQFQGHAKEADGLASICQKYVEAGLLQPQDISILLSRRSLAKRIVEALEKAGLPAIVLVSIWPLGGSDQNGRKGRYVYCILRLLVDQYDALALRTWLGLRKGIGPKAIENIRGFCMDHRLTLWDGLSTISSDPSQLQHGNKIKNCFDELSVVLAELQALETMEAVLDRLTGPDEGNPDVEKSEIRRFINSVIEKESVETLNELIFALQTFDLEAETLLETNSIRVMTMHKAKGLSSEMVIIPALEQALMPGHFEDELARRMMYVAITRARRVLIMSHALTRPGAGSHLGSGRGQWRRQRSRFLDDIRHRSHDGHDFVEKLAHQLPTRVSSQGVSLDTVALRELIREALSDEELMYFCYDHFRDVYDQFGTGMSKMAKIQRLIEFSDRRLMIDELLVRLQEFNPAQYVIYETRLFLSGT